MVWENGCVVIVMLTPLVESGVKQCYHYWPDEGSNLYHIYEVRHAAGEGHTGVDAGWLSCRGCLQVNLVSEHIWCDDFLVRSFYLKNMQTNETRTVTQFHFLTWLNQNVPESSRTLLDFRRYAPPPTPPTLPADLSPELPVELVNVGPQCTLRKEARLQAAIVGRAGIKRRSGFLMAAAEDSKSHSSGGFGVGGGNMRTSSTIASRSQSITS